MVLQRPISQCCGCCISAFLTSARRSCRFSGASQLIYLRVSIGLRHPMCYPARPPWRAGMSAHAHVSGRNPTCRQRDPYTNPARHGKQGHPAAGGGVGGALARAPQAHRCRSGAHARGSAPSALGPLQADVLLGRGQDPGACYPLGCHPHQLPCGLRPRTSISRVVISPLGTLTSLEKGSFPRVLVRIRPF